LKKPSRPGPPPPLWLAGGLRAHSVAEVVRVVQPHGLDRCTGVHSQGRLDANKLALFMDALHSAA
jgi:phosphoribosylanthranilate isomerase